MADVDKSLDEIISQRNFGGQGKRGRMRGRGRGGMRGRGGRGGSGGRGGGGIGRGGGGIGRVITQRGVVQGGRGGLQGNKQRGRGNWKNRGGFRGGKGRGGGGNNPSVQTTNINTMPSAQQVNLSLTRQATFRPQQTISVKIPDAREKLNFKARQTDARVKLIKKAQQTDARVKLNAKRRFSGEGGAPTQPPQQQTGRKQGQQINRNMGKSGFTQVTINNPGAHGQSQPHIAPTQITIKNPQAMRGQHQQQSAKKNKGGNVISLKKQTGNTVGLSGGGLKITTVNRAATLKRKAAPVLERYEEDPLDDYVSPPKRRETITRISAPSATMAASSARIKPPPVLFAPAPVSAPAPAPRISALQRVSAPRIPKPPVIQGIRIIISNLHPNVSEEDIKELFGAIGTILRARLVRAGLAEVIYSKREQALQAISTYHDRELDGQPMQCKLDTSTIPEAAKPAPPKTGMVTAATVAAASTMPQKKSTSLSDRFKLYSSSSVDLPTAGMRSDSLTQSQDSSIDPSVIHKALFKTGAATNPTQPVLFTVKI